MPVDFKETNNYQEEIKELLEKNLELSKEILRLTQKDHKILWWQSFFGYFKILLIIIPIALSFWYLPPLLDKVVQIYQQVTNLNSSIESYSPGNFNLDSLTPEFLKNTPNK